MGRNNGRAQLVWGIENCRGPEGQSLSWPRCHPGQRSGPRQRSISLGVETQSQIFRCCIENKDVVLPLYSKLLTYKQFDQDITKFFRQIVQLYGDERLLNGIACCIFTGSRLGTPVSKSTDHFYHTHLVSMQCRVRATTREAGEETKPHFGCRSAPARHPNHPTTSSTRHGQLSLSYA